MCVRACVRASVRIGFMNKPGKLMNRLARVMMMMIY